jgi:hypothetical protein
MESLRQPVQKSELIPIVTARGRMVRVDLLPIVAGRMPQWLEALLAPHMKRFAEEWCPDHWAALTRLSYTNGWRERWGSAPEQEWLVSLDPVPSDEQPSVYEVAKRLKIDVAMSLIDSRHLFAPKGTWSRR